MTDTSDLKAKWEKLEAEAVELGQEADKAREKYRDRLQKARDKAAAAQKEYLDAEAAAGLVGREDGQAIADALGLTLPDA